MKSKYISIIIIFLILGCGVYNTFSGRYWLGKQSLTFLSKPATDEDNIKIEKIVRSVAKEFGFVEDKRLSWMEEHVITFGGKRKEIKTKYDNLNGSDSTITLLIEKGPQPEVGIKDYYNNYETDFMKAFKKELETRLSEVIDMNGVVFIRHWDLMD